MLRNSIVEILREVWKLCAKRVSRIRALGTGQPSAQRTQLKSVLENTKSQQSHLVVDGSCSDVESRANWRAFRQISMRRSGDGS